jgi:pilus assembly protein Flp/PilA
MLSEIRQGLRRFLTSEDGPTAVEYAVMVALIIAVCVLAITIVGTNTNSAYNTVNKSIAKTVTGT